MSIGKYLQHYAESEIELVKDLDYQWHAVVCIPAFDETDTLTLLLERLSQENNLLAILILNCPVSASSSDALLRTQTLANLVKQQFLLQQSLSEFCELRVLGNTGSHLLLLENYAIPDHQGVGLARKIICDLACQLIHDKKILSPWIHNTDADVDLPSDYFEASLKLNNETAAALYPFKHKNNPRDKSQLSLQLYEFSLYYYVEALEWAASPYAFHTVGSTLLLHHKYYALARGFPKRSAGEDFYLLNKIKKIGAINILSKPLIRLSGRSSKRVPFGTGQAINKINELNEPKNEYLYYHPQCFLYLKKWLEVLPLLWKGNELEHLLKDKLLQQSLIEIGVEKAILHAQQHSSSQSGFSRHMHNWFDSFRTLKLIHTLRNKALDSINFEQLQDYKNEFPFITKASKSVAIE